MEQYLQSGLAAMGLPADGIPALCRYGELLLETNKVMNLTAITEPRDVAALHFLDSAALLTLEDFHGKSVVDVGTGAGFPGLPLRILEPTIRLTLLDSLSWASRMYPASTAGRRNLPAPTGNPMTWRSPGRWLPCRCCASCACPWCGPAGSSWP